MDKISVSGIVCQAHLGVTDREREIPQKVVVDIALFLNLEAAGHTDNLQLTVDYRRAIEQVQQTVEKSQFRLLEALAQKVSRALLEDGRVDSVQITARKFPESLAGKIAHVTVEMTRGH